MYFNKGTGAELRMIGRLKSVPTLRATNTGLSVTNISLAIDKHSEDGESNTEWFELTLWGKDAESFIKNAHAGIRVYVESDIAHENKMMLGAEGSKHYFKTVEYHVKQYSFMDAIQLDKKENS